MNETNWAEKIKCGETSTLQFKREKINGNSLAAEFAAFANTKGGTVLFGVEDKTGVLIGLSYEQIQDLSEYVGNVATQICNPTIYLQTETFTIEDKKILAVHVEEGVDKPYKDKDGAIWMKQGADKRKVTENYEILRLFSESKKYYPDEEAVADTTLLDLDDKKIDQYLYKVYQKDRNDFGLPFDSLMRNMHIATVGGELTLGGLLYFGKNPQQFRPNFCIKAVSFFGNELGGSEYRDSRDITGTIPEMFDDAMRFLTGNLHHVQGGQSFNSVGILEISRIALEEIVQNALCHREYIRQAAIRILIFDNRVEIVSPGALPEGMTVEEMMLGNTAQRNPLICTFCARTMIYRGLGSGIIRALQEIKDIEFVNQGNQFAIIIKRKEIDNESASVSDKSQNGNRLSDKLSNKPQLSDKLSDKSQFVALLSDKLSLSPTFPDNSTMGDEAISRMADILLYLNSHPQSKTETIATFFKLSKQIIRVYLQKLTELYLVIAHGANKNRTYSISDQVLLPDTKL